MTDTPTTRKSDAQEPSMEDILASIRRILAEDGGTASQDAAHGQASGMAMGGAAAIAAAKAAETPSETRSAAVDGVDDPLKHALSETQSIAAESGIGADLEDVFMLSPDMRAAGPPLVSQRAAENSTDVLSQLARAILDRRDIAVAARDVTLESMVREMLRPLLREWLDRNLPYLIERLVKKEIDVMINRAERLDD